MSPDASRDGARDGDGARRDCTTQTNPQALAWLADAASLRTAAGLHRRLRPREASDDVLDLASNDYLGLADDARVVQGAVDAARTWGAGSTGSRLVTGTTRLHVELEHELAAFTGAPAALVFSSGYTANMAAVSALAGPGCLVVSDAANHASLVDACRLSRADVVVVPSGDVDAVRTALATRAQKRALVVTDAVFSTDGTSAPLAALHAVCRAHEAALVVDEAHALGVTGPGGRGSVAALGLADAPDVVRTVTLSKALGSQGGAVLASADVVAHLVDTGRSFIFDTGLAPPAAGAALAALRLLAASPELVERLADRAARLAGLLDLPVPTSPVLPLVLGDPHRTLAAAQTCLDDGVRVGCFRPPSVPPGGSRLRLTARASLSETDVDRAARVVRRAVEGTSLMPAGATR